MSSPRGISLAIDLGWYQSEEGQGALAHLRDPLIGTSRKFFGTYVLTRYNENKFELQRNLFQDF